ncbi:hypothetical protein GCM10009819_29240 [Agromyces tropicus]|uniref:Uncharacterized protein n=1 Tax=Agromyces tropicus TaxID=555371 RepID=A0ABN2UQA5_9MICO
MRGTSTPARKVRAPGAALAIGAALALTGCTASLGETPSLSAWTAAIGARWDTFVAGVLAPLGDALLAVLVAWLVLAVGARLVALLPGVRDLKATRRTGAVLRVVGWTLVVLVPVAIIVATAYADDGVVAWLVVTLPLALITVGVLGPGLATRSRLDAKVIGPDGSTNTAWSIDALMQVRNANLDDPRERVERPSSPDLGEFIAIADRSGSGVASAIAWLFQVLFNSAPWLLQVTILDSGSAIATLRRNGHPLDEVELQLEWDSIEVDQHRKLLALAAGFTAMTMAERYPDVRGFYRATSWKSVGFLGLARMTRGDERRHYLSRAIEEDPTSILAEYDRIFDRYRAIEDRASLEAFLDRLEPIVNQAAWLCAEPAVFPDATGKVWHDYVRVAAELGPARLDPADLRPGVRPIQARLDERRKSRPPAPEPRAMLLRTLTLYMMAARNWAAYADLDGSVGDDPDAPLGAAGAGGGSRRERIRVALDRFIDLLEQESATPRRDPGRVRSRMRSRAALCYMIFNPEVAEDWGEEDGTRRAGTAGTSREAAAARRWLREAGSSLEIEIRYSYACFTARRARAIEAQAERHALIEEAIRGVKYARHVDYYQREATRDPELMLLGHEPQMRALVLPPISSSWQIARFGALRPRLERHGILDPSRIELDPAPEALREELGLAHDEFALLVDQARILRAGLATEEGGLTPDERLRAVRHLIDAAAYSVPALTGTFAEEFDLLARSVASAVHWVPTPDELEDVARFLVGLLARLDAETQEPEPPAPEPSIRLVS